jgi:hypothetical protein
MKLFLDVHDATNGTFPTGLTAEQFAGFHDQYLAACIAEGVINLKVHLGLGVGRAFCVNLAPDADAVRRAHERVGLPFDTITEVSDISAFATAA